MFKSNESNPAKKRARAKEAAHEKALKRRKKTYASSQKKQTKKRSRAKAAHEKALKRRKKTYASSQKKQTPPSLSFVGDDSDSDSDEEEEDYQQLIIVSHDWAATTVIFSSMAT